MSLAFDAWKSKWFSMSIEKQFETAVSLIKNLPKDGPYQPSNELMLKFYGYYKQASIGPCDSPKPSFWDVINRAKWDAWHKLGDMSSEDAMNHYVEELKQIIETMSYSTDVADFMGTLGASFYEEDANNDSNESLEDHSNPGDSGIELEPGNLNALLGNFDDAFVNGSNDVHLKAKLLESRVDQMMAEMNHVQKILVESNIQEGISTSILSEEDEDEFQDPIGDFEIDNGPPAQDMQKNIDTAIHDAVKQLNCDMEHIKARLASVEHLVSAIKTSSSDKNTSKSFLGELSPSTTAFVVIWPFIAFLMMKICNKP